MEQKTLVCAFMFIEKKMSPREFFSKHFELQKNVESHQRGKKIEITFPSIKFNYNNQTYKLSYIEKELNEKVYSLSISLSYEKDKEKYAIILDKVMELINKKRNQNFNLIFTRNDSLKYFSIRLYKLLYDFETNLRSLVKTMLIPDYKEEWHEVITSKIQLPTKLSGKAKIENIIEELSITDLENILFSKRFPKGSNLFEKELASEQLEKLTRQEIVDFININRPVSLWDTYFSHYIEYDVMSAMKIIKVSRNNVAHYREFDSARYKEALKVLNDVNPLIKETIKRLQTMEADVLLKLSYDMQKKITEDVKILAKLSINYANILRDFQDDIAKSFSNILKPIKNMHLYHEE
ncbi:hypothetical protein [Listeria innocua]|uniref:hypothetical protein n=1 Tax=Listeria innocua TaxID=1642 RepID=UPI001628F42B|nr:hypothetical protein [Listeria innocua]MBC1339160.1 hypothetical protein [Listeria innocua]